MSKASQFGKSFDRYIPMETKRMTFIGGDEQEGEIVQGIAPYTLNRMMEDEFGGDIPVIGLMDIGELSSLDEADISKFEMIELQNLRGEKFSGEKDLILEMENQGAVQIMEKKAVLGVAPTAHVIKISKKDPNLSDKIKSTMSDFDYYLVEMGVNVLLDEGIKVKKLLFHVELDSDSKDRKDVTAYDMAPGDSERYRKILSAGGEIKLGLSSMLKLIPNPAGKLLSELVNLDVHAKLWDFTWGMSDFEIQVTGRLGYEIYWKLSDTKVVNDFYPTMVIKARRGVKRIMGTASARFDVRTGAWPWKEETLSERQVINIWPV